jgi:adenylosuccinate lyase
VDELTKIKNDLKNNEQLVSEQTTTIQAILMERDDLNNLIQKLSKEKVNQNKPFDT